MSKFQIVLIVIFGLFILIGVITFSLYRGSANNAVNIYVWGTIDKNIFDNAIKESSLDSDRFNVIYTFKNEETFDTEFIEALASGEGPDIFLLPSTKIIKHRNKILPIPYDVFTLRQFRDLFIEGAEIYTAPEGILAVPVYTNPLVMYWNRTLFTNSGITEVPKYWDEFYDLAKKISKKDGALNINQSAVALGEFANINNAKEIYLNLAMQAGTPIVSWNQNSAQSVLNYPFNKPIIPAEAALNFYTEFSNPSKQTYSWNRAMPNSLDYFLSGDLAVYFGFADEASKMQLKNPNLNFDVFVMPMSREGGVNTSFADFYGFALAKSTLKPNQAYSIIYALMEKQTSQFFSKELKLPPVRRDLLTSKPINLYESVFFDSAIKAKGWLDPSYEISSSVFKEMIESVTSGRLRTGESVDRASRELDSLFQK